MLVWIKSPPPTPTCTLVVSTSFGLCFPTSFSVSLPLPLCSPAVPVLYSSLPSIRPLSAICSPSSCFLSDLPGDPPYFCLSSTVSALPSSQLSGTPKRLCFLSARFLSQLHQSLSLPAGYCSVSQGPNTCIPFAGSLCELRVSTVALFETPDLQPLSLEGYRRGRQRVRWWDTIPGLNGHESEQTLEDTGVAKTRTEHHLPFFLTCNSPEILFFSKLLSFPHPLPKGYSLSCRCLLQVPHNPLHCHRFSLMLFSIFYFSRSRCLCFSWPHLAH